MSKKLYQHSLKPCIDFFLATLALAFLTPLFVIVAILIKLDSKGPIFYTQERIGKENKPFTMLKFRSMKINADQMGALITHKNDPRLTKMGTLLRRIKLDELPQLMNVVKGDMAIVGPRPEVKKYIEKFKKEYEEILEIKPGITDFATLEYVDEEAILATFKDKEQGYITEVLPQKIKLSKRYKRELSFRVDMRLIIKTLAKIIA
ncbi:MAG: sugar transferase [bacterium]